MICSECNRTYLNESEDRKLKTSLIGLCRICGTETRSHRFLVSYGTGAMIAGLAFELLFFVSLLSSWKRWILILVILTLVYYFIWTITRNSAVKRYESIEQRSRSTIFQRIVGGLFGFFLAWFLAIVMVTQYV